MPYSGSFKEVMAMVQAGKMPPDVVDVDDSPLTTPSMATGGAPNADAPKPRAKPWERNLSGNKAPVAPLAPNGYAMGGGGPEGVEGQLGKGRLEDSSPLAGGIRALPVSASPFEPGVSGGGMVLGHSRTESESVADAADLGGGGAQ